MPRPEDPDLRVEREAQILEAARTVFAKKGLNAARMADIAAQSGLSKGTLYLYYKNKDDLVAGLLEAFLAEQLDGLRALVEQTDHPPKERLMQYVAGVSAAMEADASILSIAYGFYAAAAHTPAIREMLQSYFTEYRRLFEVLFNQGGHPADEASQAAIAMIALLEGFTLLWFTDPDAVQWQDVLPGIVQRFVGGPQTAPSKGEHDA